MGFVDRWPKLSRRCHPTDTHGKTWLIAIHCSQKTFHFLSVSNGPTYFIRYCNNPTEITRNYFCGVFWKITNTFEKCFWDVSETSRKKIFFEICSRSLKHVTQKIYFLKCIWDVLKTSQKSHLFRDVLRGPWDVSLNEDLIEISQRHLMSAGKAFKKYEYEHLIRWYIKSPFYSKSLNLNKIFRKRKQLPAKLRSLW